MDWAVICEFIILRNLIREKSHLEQNGRKKKMLAKRGEEGSLKKKKIRPIIPIDVPTAESYSLIAELSVDICGLIAFRSTTRLMFLNLGQ
mmetsp:Transcript_24835/g.34688  ORF Transcript_24835/g.34688 Transcript_24835/m.34688 type:complete len:90 (+) Transcript_24835:174-443(+)